MIESAWNYHCHTSYDRYDMKGHFLDWGSQPGVFKQYPGLKTVSLSRELSRPELKLSDLARGAPAGGLEGRINLERLTRILMLTHSLTAKIGQAGGEFYFRSVASAGALYPFELYVAVANSDGIQDGLYHHDVANQRLVLLRPGSVFSGGEYVPLNTAGGTPALAFFLTAIFYRSSWKYRDRAYRYHLLDTGHLAENLTLALLSEGLKFRFCVEFNDDRVNAMLGLDASREVCLAVVPVLCKATDRSHAEASVDPLGELAAASKVAAREVDYPAIGEIHKLTARPAVVPSGVPDMALGLGLELGEPISFPAGREWPERSNYVETVMKRRSMRNFVKNRLPLECMSAFLDALGSGPLSALDAEPIGNLGLVVGFLAGNVEGLDPGFYVLDPESRSIRCASRGDFLDEMTYACLNQEWLSNCAIHFLFLADIPLAERTWGPRAYRHLMLHAGRLGQRLYLAATAMRLGCCGIGAYYDDEAARILGLNAESRLLYLVAAGPVRKYAPI